MPLLVPASGFGRVYQQTAKAGVTVTAGGAAHTMGAWTTLINPLDYDVFAVGLRAWGVSAAATDTRMLADIGVAPTGGGGEQVVVPFLDLGAATTGGVGRTYIFPLYLPKGKALQARCQSVIASDTVLIAAHAFMLPPHGFAENTPQQWVQYGADVAASRGTAVTAAGGAFGTEVEVTGGAGTSRAHRWFHVGIDLRTTTASAGIYRVRLARDTAASEIIGIWDFFVTTSSEDISGPFPAFPVCCPTPAGTLLYVDIDGPAPEALSAIVYAY